MSLLITRKAITDTEDGTASSARSDQNPFGLTQPFLILGSIPEAR